MARPKIKNSKALNVMIEKTVYDALDDFARVSGLTKTAIIEKSVNAFIAKNKKKII